MKIPSKDMMEHVYKVWIMNKTSGMKSFGRYTITGNDK
jgi:hypothetical protein